MCLLIYSSIDIDYFTQLQIATLEFQQWFKSQERGEPTLQFEHKSQQWNAVAVYAIEVVHAHGGLTSDFRVILTETWWNNIRLQGFARKFKNALTSPNKPEHV